MAQRTDPPRSTGGDISLAAALARGGIHRDVAGATVEETLAAVARLPGLPGVIDRTVLRRMLLAREALASTGLGGGIAVPHPREPPGAGLVQAPTVALCFLGRAVDWRAIDGAPVRVLFVLLSPDTRTHLMTLSRLAYALRDETFAALVAANASADALLARARALDPPAPR